MIGVVHFGRKKMKITLETTENNGIIAYYNEPTVAGTIEKRMVFTSFWGMIDWLCNKWGIAKSNNKKGENYE